MKTITKKQRPVQPTGEWFQVVSVYPDGREEIILELTDRETAEIYVDIFGIKWLAGGSTPVARPVAVQLAYKRGQKSIECRRKVAG